MRIVPIFGALLLAALLIFVGATGALWYQNHVAQKPETGTAPPAPAAASTPAARRSGADVIEMETLRELLALVDAQRRRAILDSRDIFERFIEQERANQAVLTAAYANAADRNEAVQTLMVRASQKVLAEAYLAQVVRQNLDADFPDETQAREYYDANRDAFRLPDRVHVWQVFIPAGEDATDVAKTNARALATRIAGRLRAGETTFADAAAKHSRHLQSRVNDGYMGLLKTDDLLPEVRTAIEALDVDAIGEPVESAAGYHVIRRGALVTGQQLDYDAVREQVIRRMRQEAANRVRQAALKKILETYPVAVDESAFDGWLDALRSADWPTSTGT